MYKGICYYYFFFLKKKNINLNKKDVVGDNSIRIIGTCSGKNAEFVKSLGIFYLFLIIID